MKRAVNKKPLILLLFPLIVVLATASSPSALQFQAQQTAAYVGPEACSTCHSNIYQAWNVSLHSTMIRPLTADLLAEYGIGGPPTDPKSAANHSITVGPNFPYTIGGNWKLRFLNATDAVVAGQPNNYTMWTVGVWQYIVATGEWEPYHPEAPSDWGAKCAQCHTTGFDSATETFSGIELSDSITCESCHGPGSDHVTNPTANPMIIDVSAQVCGQCHVRGTFPEYELGNPASFNFTSSAGAHKHHQQFIDWNISAHSRSMEVTLFSDYCLTCHSADNIFNTDLIKLLDVIYTLKNATNPVTCVICHSPHTLDLRISHGEESGTLADEITVCAQCHTGGARVEDVVKEVWHHTQAELFNGSVHYFSGVTCVSCHMALDTKSAVAYDLRNHTMIVKSYDTYAYSCGQAIGCHKEQLETWPDWAEQRIEEIQTIVSSAIVNISDAVTSAEAAITTANQTASVDKTAIENAANLLTKAKSYLSFVEADGSEGFHNPTYALSLLNIALYYARQAESTALETRAETLAGTVSDLQGQITTLQGNITTLQGDIESLEKRIDDLEATSATAPYLYAGIGIAVGFAIGAIVLYVVRRK